MLEQNGGRNRWNSTSNQLIVEFQSINQASKKYESQKKIIGADAYHKLKEFSSNFEADALSIIENNRKLKIGVVGQIKAGKSSFLNSLLFDGKDFLPKAATPMTAALQSFLMRKVQKRKLSFIQLMNGT